ncbi:hypothetical protein [Streptococcus macacae]|uniref:Uncharacterized protein n=1 Tax=Streptococcus macacae NCTC 11558 TaxID=764298 RepID=G5JYU6_9STRE|nr:hypothetical protein [Streptococcus macacae]EHJ52860.1 hypothetical protein STRMA_0360 [Streptococcus macacae NCTC 11558]SUN78203.1 Uncharacterised protein [Streptococcus macacae NCTC 11558]
MALTDQQIQQIQGKREDYPDYKKRQIVDVGNRKHHVYYKVVNVLNGTTQAVALAPCDKNGKHIDYNQTAIVVNGTQPGINQSTDNALKATGGMTPQYSDIKKFYHATEKKVSQHDGTISNMSGYSQSGPAVAKVAAQYKVKKVTNFMDWGAQAAYDHGDITKKEKSYLDKHATVYTDSTKDITWADGHGGTIPYGKKIHIEGSWNPVSDHDPKYPHIKGNGPDINWYIKHHQFCSGMTKAQVEQVAKYKAKHDLDPFKSKEDYMTDYKKLYGAYAKVKKAKVNKWAVDKKAGKGKTAPKSASKKILLRKSQLTALASQAVQESETFEQEVAQKLAEAKASVQDLVDRTRAQAYEIAQHLPAGEVEELLARISFHQVWDEGAEEANRAEVREYSQKIEQLSDNLKRTAAKLEEADLEEASQINLL